MRSFLRPLRLPRALPRRAYSTAGSARLNQFLKVSEEVQHAITEGKPVVALESAIYSHGFPNPQNLELALAIEKTIRENGAIPATIAILNGKAVVGLDRSELEQLADAAGQKGTVKVSRRDLPFVTGIPFVDPSRKYVGGTTIAGTSIVAHMAGIKVFATGGLGGVHRGVEKSMDVSADLTELGRTNIAVICSGSKAFLDLEKTLEYLETEGVYVGTFGNRDSPEPVPYPAFYSRDAGLISPSVVGSAEEAAAIIYASHSMGLRSGQLFANPIPEEHEIPNDEIQEIIKDAVKAAEKEASGRDVTPWILADIMKRTQGRSIKANRGLIMNNAVVGAQVAVALAKLEGQNVSTQFMPPPTPPPSPSPSPSKSEPSKPLPTEPSAQKTPSSASTVSNPEVLVIGGIAVDVSCDFTPSTSTSTPALHTSNPSRITDSLGGVANNVAYALHLSGTRTRLISSVGDDASGRWITSAVAARGMDTTGLSVSDAHPTARYVAINDAAGGLFVASADMSLISSLPATPIISALRSSGASWAILDGNLSTVTTQSLLTAAKEAGTRLIFEPTSTAKSTAIFASASPPPSFPDSHVFAAAPNIHELGAMYAAADSRGLFSTDLPWWNTVDSLLIEAGFRIKLEALSMASGTDLLADGTLQKAINLAPYIPNLFVKLGEKGVVVVKLLAPGDKMLEGRAPHGTLVQRAREGESVGGLYVRHFPAEKAGEVVSVNGAGDTFLGVLVSGLVRGDGVEKAVGRAQRAAVKTLGSREAVSADIKGLE